MLLSIRSGLGSGTLRYTVGDESAQPLSNRAYDNDLRADAVPMAAL
jgi:hypothetical protein